MIAVQRRRQTRQDELQDGQAEHEGAAEVAGEDVAEEADVLLIERPVEAVGPDRGGADFLGGVRRDEDVDRVADGVDADEHQRGHHQHDEEGLENALDDEAEHQEPVGPDMTAFSRLSPMLTGTATIGAICRREKPRPEALSQARRG